MKFPGFCDQTYQSGAVDFVASRSINLFPEKDFSGQAKSQNALRKVPGLTSIITLPDDPVRCLWAGEDRVFTVAGAKYGEIVVGPTFEDRGTLAEDTQAAKIFSNGTQLLIYSRGKAYYDNGGAASGSNAVEITVASGAADVTYIDGYGVILGPNSNDVYVSSLMDFSTWDALDTLERTRTVDRLVGIRNHNGQLWLFGKRSIDVWWNSGNADFPFQPIDGSTLDIGTEYPDTIVSLGGALYFVSVNERGGAVVYRLRGSSPERISTPGIEALIPALAGNPIGWGYEDQGQQFYVINFLNSSGLPSLVYNATDGKWHERGHWNGTLFDSYLGRCHCFPTKGYGGFGGVHLVGARNSGKVYTQKFDNADFDGTAIRMRRQAPHLSDEERRTLFHCFELDVMTGNQASGTPDAELSWSDDFGRTFNTAKTASLGASTNYTQRVKWHGLGSGRSRTFRVEIPSFGGPLAITDAYLRSTQGVR